MKTILTFRTTFYSILLCSLAPNATAQPPFQNLDFESATFVPIPGDPHERVQFAPALPGWTGYLGGVPQSLALHNVTFISVEAIGVLDAAWPNGGLIQGNYSAFLQPAPGLNIDASLAQTGLVPLVAKSLRFYAIPHATPFGTPQAGDPIGTFSVMMGGQELPVFELGVGPNNSTLFGVDVVAWAGQTTELRFTTFAAPGGQFIGWNNLFLDSIRFSPLAVPEPGTWALLGLGLAALAGRLKRQSHRKP
jgi:hypothetical protein